MAQGWRGDDIYVQLVFGDWVIGGSLSYCYGRYKPSHYVNLIRACLYTPSTTVIPNILHGAKVLQATRTTVIHARREASRRQRLLHTTDILPKALCVVFRKQPSALFV